jgi:predicted peptidase
VAGSFSSASLKTTVGYLVDLPGRYDTAGAERFPLLIFLHGIGERGNNGGAELSKVDKWGLPRLARRGARFPMILISPQLPATQKRWPVALIDELIAAVSEIYRVDGTRIYLTGLSTGADGAWVYAVARPGKVVAIVPISGQGNPAGICAMRDVAVWAFHGGEDKDEPPKHDQRLVEALNACQPPPAEAARLTVYPGAGHEVWSRTYDGSGGYDIYAWLLAHHR